MEPGERDSSRILLWQYAAEVTAREVYDSIAEASEGDRHSPTTLHPGDPFGRVVTEAWNRDPDDAVMVLDAYVGDLRRFAREGGHEEPTFVNICRGLQRALPELSSMVVVNELIPYFQKHTAHRDGGLTVVTELSCSVDGCGRTGPSIDLFGGGWLMLDGAAYCPDHARSPVNEGDR